jgi:CBS domain-containing protein
MKQLTDVMSRDVKVVGPDTSMREAAQHMRDGDFGLLPVVEDDRIIGTISDRDITVRGVAEGKDPTSKVRDAMSTGLAWVYEDESIEYALELMSKRQVRRLPVISRAKRLVGIVALGDISEKKSEAKPTAKALSEISKPS